MFLKGECSKKNLVHYKNVNVAKIKFKKKIKEKVIKIVMVVKSHEVIILELLLTINGTIRLVLSPKIPMHIHMTKEF